MKIVAFGASTSRQSINKAFATYAAAQFEGHELELLDLNDFACPLFSTDAEKQDGFPAGAKAFREKLQGAGLLVFSLAEHNGSWTAAFKNLFDWCSRIQSDFFQGRPVFLLSTSPGGRGGKGSMDYGLVRLPLHGARIVAHFSLPKFHDNFAAGQGITEPGLAAAFAESLAQARASL